MTSLRTDGGRGYDSKRYDKFSCTATILPLASATTHRRQNIRKKGTAASGHNLIATVRRRTHNYSAMSVVFVVVRE